ncbi:DUF4238 domain-containing protein [Nocardia beijingensis]|uniref:DUF4238 domain-containing protein n=1 Tax=Nocardia beijingensis TaxID=95162 RepID=UPI00344F708F
MRSLQRWMKDTEIEESKARAARDTGDQWRHHFVPEVYLKRWVGVKGGRLRWTDVNAGTGAYASPKSVAFLPHFYRYDAPGDPGQWFEKHLSRIEDDAAPLFRHLDAVEDGPIRDSATAANLAIYVALQHQRTPRVRALNLAIESWNPTGQDPQTAAINYAVNIWRKDIVPELKRYRWWIVSSPSPLATCDEPVLHLGHHDWPRHTRLSFKSTALLLFPIGPYRLLIAAPDRNHTLVPPYELTPEETMAVNSETAANSLQFVYEQEDAGVAATLRVPPPVAAPHASSANLLGATVLPTRWASLPTPPPWPLSRWLPPMPGWLRPYAQALGNRA